MKKSIAQWLKFFSGHLKRKSGEEKVYLLKEKLKAKLGKWEQEIPVGFLERDEIPPILGRQDFLETFDTLFTKNHVVSFSK